jgi:hypothetical protein
MKVRISSCIRKGRAPEEKISKGKIKTHFSGLQFEARAGKMSKRSHLYQ